MPTRGHVCCKRGGTHVELRQGQDTRQPAKDARFVTVTGRGGPLKQCDPILTLDLGCTCLSTTTRHRLLLLLISVVVEKPLIPDK
jgi:hypothetical protein